MSRTRTPARRFRFVATFAAVLGLAMSGVVATPAFAAGDIDITLYDNSTALPFVSTPVIITNADESFSTTSTTDGAGHVTLTALPNDTYYVNPDAPTYYPSMTSIVVEDNVVTTSIGIDRRSVVTGSITSDAADGHSAATVQLDVGGTWVDYAAGPIDSVDGSFTFVMSGGSGSYRLVFSPDDSVNYSPTVYGPFAGGVDNTVVDIGSIALTPAGVISGAVADYVTGDPISGVTVYVSSDTTAYPVVTDSSGAFVAKLPQADEIYTVQVTASGYLTQYWDHVADAGDASAIVLSSGNGYEQAGVDFDLQPAQPTLSGTVLTVDDTSVGYTLFKQGSGGAFGPVAYDSNLYGTSFFYSELPDGVYRLAFRHPFENYWLPWQSAVRNGTPITAASTASDCYLEVTVAAGLGDIAFDDVALDLAQEDTYCDSPPWSVPANGEFSGTVTNIASFDHVVRAQLYLATGGELLDTSVVDPATGAYSLAGIATSNGYFVLFDTDNSDPFLDTLLGDDGGDQYIGWADDMDAWNDVSGAYAISLTADTDSTGNDIELPGAALYTGTVRSGSSAVPYACVEAISVIDPSFTTCTGADENGDYWLKLPVGQDWVLHVGGTYGYDDQYWSGRSDFADADEITATAGAHPGYDFDLVGWPPYLLGVLFEESTGLVDDIIVHLYKPVTGGYQEVAQTTTSPLQFVINFEFDDTIVSTSPYRLRFETQAGEWLLLSQKLITDGTGLFADSPEAITACYIDIAPLRAGPETVAVVGFDEAEQPSTCGAEPAVTPGTVPVPPPLVKPTTKPKPRAFVAATPVELPAATPTPIATPEPTAEPDDEPTVEPSASPSADPEPTSAPFDLTWLWIVIAAVVVLLLGCAAFVVFRRR